jgi:two-component system chemotaxis response regulator CheB
VERKFRALVIGGSAGSFPLVTRILHEIPKNFPMPVLLCLHRLKHVRHGFVEALSIKSNIPVVEPEDKEPIKAGKAYLAPSNYHMYVELGNHFALSTDEMVKFSRPSIDLTFETASYAYRDKMVGIMLSGANTDGADGMFRAHKRGAYTIVQNPEEAGVKTMPEGCLKLFTPDEVLNLDQIIKFIKELSV